jgi:endonuclease-8
MPEGPSLVLLKEETIQFQGKLVKAATGNAKIDKDRLLNKKLIAIKTWGKHFLLCFKGFTIRIHLLMFGTYRINEQKNAQPRLSLTFTNGELNFYTCSVTYLEGDVNSHYDWTADVMNEQWNPKAAKVKLKKIPEQLICDALLEQDIFSGVGNIIKNEVLYRVKTQPESKVKNIPAAKINKLVTEARNYSFQFLDWKREYELKKHWLVHTRKVCPSCKGPILKKYTGIKKRRSFFCVNCQILYK